LHHGGVKSEAHGPALASEFTALAGAWLATHRSWNTRTAYEADLAWFADWCAQTGRAPLRVTQADIEEHRADCEASGSSPASIRRRLAALVAMLMHAGLKLGEALEADVDDFSTPPPTLSIVRQGRPRRLELPASTAAAISAYTAGRDTGPLLLSDSPSRVPDRLTRWGADRILKRVTEQAGLAKTVSANTLRRYYAANAHANGTHIDEIRAHLGHDDRRTTRRLLVPEHPSPQQH
jgi:site-specific recombinase XerD